jgi:hypothetical protein
MAPALRMTRSIKEKLPIFFAIFWDAREVKLERGWKRDAKNFSTSTSLFARLFFYDNNNNHQLCLLLS